MLLRDQSLSISGSLGQFMEIEGRRYGHVIDPRSGAPLERERIAAVLAANGARAEALSKALLILGEHDGVALLETLPDAQGILLDADGHAFETRGWRAASRYLPESPTSAALRPIHGRLPKRVERDHVADRPPRRRSVAAAAASRAGSPRTASRSRAARGCAARAKVLHSGRVISAAPSPAARAREQEILHRRKIDP